jgi:hypothetical protein
VKTLLLPQVWAIASAESAGTPAGISSPPQASASSRKFFMRLAAQALYFCHPQIGLARVACCLGLPIDFSAFNA